MPVILQGMTETIAFPLWAAAVAAAVTALLAIVAMYRIGGRQVLGMVVAAVAVLGIGSFVAQRLDSNTKAEQRRAIEARVASLASQALAPNSMLSCLDAAGGTLVHEACEKALFASPEQVAASLNYVGARLDLLREIAMVAGMDDTTYDSLRTPLLRSLEADRFGLVAQVLVERDGCSVASCYAFELLPQNRQVVSNMSERAYDMRVARFAATWNDKPGGPALAAQSAPSMPSQMPTSANFPSAASIPPVSIMSNEPGRPGQNGVETPPRAEAARSEPVKPERPQVSPAPPRRPAQKAQAPKREPQPAQQPSAPADPFPQPVGGAQQTTGAPPQ